LVEASTGRATELRPKIYGRWHSLIVSAPKNPFRLEITDQSLRSWVAVGEIQELGRLSFYTLLLRDQAVTVLLAGLGLWVVLAGRSVIGRGLAPGAGGFVGWLIFLAGLMALTCVWSGRHINPAAVAGKLYQGWAIDCERQGDLPGAERHWRQALWQQPDNPEALATLANIILRDPAREPNQAREQAVWYYEAALRLKPGYAEAQQQLDRILREPGCQNTTAH
jgi:tetratricopeptide (TPR) repeat protein